MKKETRKYVRTDYTDGANKYSEKMKLVTAKFRKFSELFSGVHSFECSNFGQLIALNAIESTAQNCEGLQSSTVQAMRAANLNAALQNLEKTAPRWDEMLEMGEDLIREIDRAHGFLCAVRVMLDAEHHAASIAASAKVKPKKI